MGRPGSKKGVWCDIQNGKEVLSICTGLFGHTVLYPNMMYHFLKITLQYIYVIVLYAINDDLLSTFVLTFSVSLCICFV